MTVHNLIIVNINRGCHLNKLYEKRAEEIIIMSLISLSLIQWQRKRGKDIEQKNVFVFLNSCTTFVKSDIS